MTGEKGRINFTAEWVKGLTAESGQSQYQDMQVKGLFLRISPKGSKSFFVRRKSGSKSIRITISRWPDHTIKQVRDKAQATLANIGDGINPIEERKEQERSAVSLAQAVEAYIASRGDKLKPATAKQYTALTSKYSQDWLNFPLAKIDRAMVEMRHRAISEGVVTWQDKAGETVRMRKPSQAQADLWARILRLVYNFARDHYRSTSGDPLLPESPVSVLSSKRQWNNVARRSTRIRNHQLGAWLAAVDTVRRNGDRVRACMCDALDFALFTGLRRSEVIGLTWDRVNFAGRYFWISETKNGEPLELPITTTLMSILKRRKEESRLSGSRFVFAGSDPSKPVNDPRKTIAVIQAQTEQDGQEGISFGWHDLRRTYGSVAELVGVGSYILKRLLNHKTGRSNDVTQGYIVFSADELHAPAAQIERYLLEQAGLIEAASDMDQQLTALLSSVDEETKRKVMFDLSRMLFSQHNEKKLSNL